MEARNGDDTSRVLAECDQLQFPQKVFDHLCSIASKPNCLLHIASFKNDVEGVRRAIESGADLNSVLLCDITGKRATIVTHTAVLAAVRRCRPTTKVEVLKNLVCAQMTVNVIQTATLANCAAAMAVLVEACAHVRGGDKLINDALRTAVRCTNVEAGRVLLKSSIGIAAVHDNLFYELEALAQEGVVGYGMPKARRLLTIMSMLLKQQPSFPAWKMLLAFCAHCGLIEYVQLLLEYGVDTDAPFSSSQVVAASSTSLHNAMSMGISHAPITRLLLQHGANARLLNAIGRTPEQEWPADVDLPPDIDKMLRKQDHRELAYTERPAGDDGSCRGGHFLPSNARIVN